MSTLSIFPGSKIFHNSLSFFIPSSFSKCQQKKLSDQKIKGDHTHQKISNFVTVVVASVYI
jgi:hypothetical protein